ncbi:MAG: ParB/RepB/Spo0J family partition protein [Candidatus Paceibacterota bacterium]
MSRGLESLIPKKGKQNKEDVLSAKESVFWIETKKIRKNPYQPRALFKKKDIESLAESIKKYGVLQPLIVTKIDVNIYELIAGERRLRACLKANIDKVPVIIRKPNKQEKLEIALIENIQRKNLNPMEKAEAFKRLKEEFGLFDRQIAEIMGKSREVITNTIRFLNLSEFGREALRNEQISEGHAKVLLSLESVEEQDMFLKQVLEENLKIRDLEKRIREYKNPRKELNLRDSACLLEFENRFKKVLKYDNIKIKTNKKNYQVVISFKSEKELEGFVDNL